MEVTDVRVGLVKTDSAVKAMGSFSLDGVFVVRGIRILEDKSGNTFLGFPAREKKDGSYEDIAFPLKKDLYNDISNALINEYKVQKEKQVEAKEEAKEETLTEAEAQTATKHRAR